MPTLSGTSVKGRQFLFWFAPTDVIWSIRVTDPDFPLHTQQKYYGTMSQEYNLVGVAQPYQSANQALWTAGRVVTIVRPVGVQIGAVMHWRYGGIAFVAVSG